MIQLLIIWKYYPIDRISRSPSWSGFDHRKNSLGTEQTDRCLSTQVLNFLFLIRKLG